MSRFFQVVVILWALYHIGWVMGDFDGPFLEGLALAMVATGLCTWVGALLVRRNRFVRFLLLLAVVSQAAFLAVEADLWLLDDHYFGEMPSDPSTGWATNLSLLLTGFVLMVAYVTPVADDFEVRRAPHASKLRAVVSAISRTDGAVIASLTSVALVLFVVNQTVIAARYAENSPHAIVSGASDRLETARSSGDEEELRYAYVELGDAYWSLNDRDQAVSMYEQYVALDLENQSYRFPHELSRVIPRLVWFYAAAADDRFGDGAHALQTAEKLPESLRGAAYFDSVAAVYARRGLMEKAVGTQRLAIDMCTSDWGCCKEHWEYAYRLEQYAREGDPD